LSEARLLSARGPTRHRQPVRVVLGCKLPASAVGDIAAASRESGCFKSKLDMGSPELPTARQPRSCDEILLAPKVLPGNSFSRWNAVPPPFPQNLPHDRRSSARGRAAFQEDRLNSAFEKLEVRRRRRLLLSTAGRHTKREGKRHNGNNAPYRHGLAYYLPNVRGERPCNRDQFGFREHAPPESPIWTSDSRSYASPARDTTSLPLEADPLTPSEKASSRETGFEEIQSECGSQGFHFPQRLIGSWRAISSDFRTRDASAKSVSSRRMIGHTTSGKVRRVNSSTCRPRRRLYLGVPDRLLSTAGKIPGTRLPRVSHCHRPSALLIWSITPLGAPDFAERRIRTVRRRLERLFGPTIISHHRLWDRLRLSTALLCRYHPSWSNKHTWGFST